MATVPCYILFEVNEHCIAGIDPSKLYRDMITNILNILALEVRSLQSILVTYSGI
jgi:hypothetical protein